MSVVIVPGKGGSGPDHWQTWLEQRLPNATRVHQTNWEVPELDLWADAVARELRHSPKPPLLVAHSFGCLATARALLQESLPTRGVIMVAPADPSRFSIPETTLFRPLPGIVHVCASSNDPWLSQERCMALAQAWGADVAPLGEVGHINVDSGFGPWSALLHWVKDYQPEKGIPDELIREYSSR